MQEMRNGRTMDYTCTAAVAKDDVIVVGAVVGIAASAGEIDEVITLDTVGVYELKANTAAITQGAAVYWDATNKEVTTTATGNTLMGHAWEASGSGVLTALVKINA